MTRSLNLICCRHSLTRLLPSSGLYTPQHQPFSNPKVGRHCVPIIGHLDQWVNINKCKVAMDKSTSICFVILGFLCLTAFAKSPRPITDYETREKKNACYADIESGLWGLECKSSMIAKENCALKCLSPVCYRLVYESDPLEEGEKDYVRGQEYKYCMHRVSLGEGIDGVKGSFDL